MRVSGAGLGWKVTPYTLDGNIRWIDRHKEKKNKKIYKFLKIIASSWSWIYSQLLIFQSGIFFFFKDDVENKSEIKERIEILLLLCNYNLT